MLKGVCWGRLCQKVSLEKCVLRREPQERSPAAVSMQLKWLAACMHTSNIHYTINTGGTASTLIYTVDTGSRGRGQRQRCCCSTSGWLSPSRVAWARRSRTSPRRPRCSRRLGPPLFPEPCFTYVAHMVVYNKERVPWLAATAPVLLPWGLAPGETLKMQVKLYI